jgi:hypothetical protein
MLEDLMQAIVVLQGAAQALQEPVYVIADDCADYFSQMALLKFQTSHGEARAKRAPSGSQGLSLNPLLALFNLFTTTLISIDDAPIRFKSLRRTTLFALPSELAALSAKHYRAELWRAALMVALSLDCIGKPYETLTDLAGGLHALLVRPLVTLCRRPASGLSTQLSGGVSGTLSAHAD